jgi:hypothetical protein
MSSVVEISKIDLNQVKIAPNKSKSERVFLKLFYNKNKLVFKIPKSKVPFNAQKNNYGQMEVFLSIKGDYAEYFNALDEKIKELVKEVKPNNDLVFSPSLRQNNPEYDPLFKFKVLKNDDKYPSFFNEDKQPITISNDEDILAQFKKRNQVICAVEISGIWIMGDKYGATYRLVQTRVFSSSLLHPQDEDYAFDDSESSESEYLFDD